MRFLACALVLTAGCYEPVFMTGLYCSEDDTCPPGQACYVFSTGGGRCDLYDGTDAGRIITIDAPRQVDGPPQQIDAALCSTVSQTGCNIGQKCTIVDAATAAIGCQATGTLTVGSVCVGLGVNDNCVAGALCVFETCHAFCDTAAPSCGADVCVELTPIGACTTTCNPLVPACPMSSNNAQNCYVTNTGNGCLPSSQNRPVGSACTYMTDCAAGSGCDGPTGSSTCKKYCDFGMYPNQPGTCDAGQTCQMLVDNIGMCL